MSATQYYCRFNEDAILDRLTGYLPIGFYIDVGAHSPTHESLTRCFYDRGWSGINIEPQPNLIAELAIARPRDMNLQLACGMASGELQLYVNGGLTTAKKEYAQLNWPTTTVLMKPLGLLCDIYVKDKEITFLKIDVEGYELDVILGMNWNQYRPKVLCVESTIPNTTTGIYEEWDLVLVKNGYTYVESNPYNRFYVDSKV